MKKYAIALSLYGMIGGIALGSGIAGAEIGSAVHYSNRFQGKKTASGEIFDQNELTAAHKKFSYGTHVRVTNLDNNQSVIVKINDRMAKHNKDVIDVSRRAAKELGFINKGRARISLEEIK